MSKWRAVLVGAMAAGALGAGLFVPAQAQEVPVPGLATVKADGDPAAASGYVVVQGDSSSGIPSIGGGYIGVEGSDGSGNVVACADGTWEEGGDNNVILTVPPTGAPEAPDPESPCAPSAP